MSGGGVTSAGGPPAVVVGLASVTGLQTARILSGHGIRVIGIVGDRRHFGARTRVCDRVIEADVHGDDVLEALVELGPDLDERAVLFPCTDQSVLAVSRHRERLAPWYRLVLPDDDLVQTLTRKASFYEHAGDAGLPVPVTFSLRSREQAVAAAGQVPYPAVVKPSVKSTVWKARAGMKALPVQDADELLRAFDRLAPFADSLIVQQYVAGADDQLYTCNTYYGTDGQQLVSFTTRKCRQWPPHVGTASYAAETRNDQVVALAEKLFGGGRFRGLGYLEVKVDPDDDQMYVMEANIGRPTGRSATAEAGGVELLLTMYCDVAGLPLPAAREQRHLGTTWVDVRRDFLSAMYYRRRGELRLRDWVRQVWSADAHAVASTRDPVPFCYDLGQSVRKALNRARGRGVRGASDL